MKFFIKPEGSRRYHEADDSDVLFAARDILMRRNFREAYVGEINGIAMTLHAEEQNEYARVTKTLESQEKKPL